MRTQSEHADPPTSPRGAASTTAACLLLVSLEEARVEAASRCLLGPCRAGRRQSAVSGEEAGSTTGLSLSVVRQCFELRLHRRYGV